jgi:polysaccharide biosynthesis transport protein
LRQTHTETSPEVVQLKAELERSRALLANQEATDSAREVLSGLKKKQRKLQMAVKLFENNQNSLSLAERALPPRKTKLTQVIRYGIPGIAGLLAGMFLGGISIVMLNLLDPRLFVAEDVAAVSGLPVLGTIPTGGIKKPDFARLVELPLPCARAVLLQTLGKLDLLGRSSSRVVVVTSAEGEASSDTVALQLAALMARDHGGRVLLVDAHFDRPALTHAGAALLAPQLAEMMAGRSELRGKGDLVAIESGPAKDAGILDFFVGGKGSKVIYSTKLARLSFVGTGRVDLRDQVGSIRESWARFVEQNRDDYGFIVVHAGGLLNTKEAASLAQGSDRVLLVTDRKVSRLPALGRVAALLDEIGASTLGVVHCESKQKGFGGSTS